ncbi:hypothetical protein AVEN_197588-1 [Araneus ventricosus]|uniref:Uncharacterized protein n=1 Tax=Araneus ventricosus TaxID=182803 RepID=A0A4Y2R4C3_ARAVE|nr:hypothetical protein AVEN_197588-1 [Araneus ventricosus]
MPLRHPYRLDGHGTSPTGDAGPEEVKNNVRVGEGGAGIRGKILACRPFPHTLGKEVFMIRGATLIIKTDTVKLQLTVTVRIGAVTDN